MIRYSYISTDGSQHSIHAPNLDTAKECVRMNEAGRGIVPAESREAAADTARPEETVNSYYVTSRWLVAGEGWDTATEVIYGLTYRNAWIRASQIAECLDGIHGNSHHWNVLLTDSDGSGIVELFHGRLS